MHRGGMRRTNHSLPPRTGRVSIDDDDDEEEEEDAAAVAVS